ncbi:patatin-like phospholipase family protein [Erythrobacter mangrovi]|uniref:Patatin-like phospholipase family protein n=1 Tax=Erythrobacter mangrovi TaxID=2739433 RepID=A0A7D3XBX1_9SPHN|nr:patatin-like phospholipase family protein [Erythrobacter mangrovi]QKG71950.1 patatin-like phospholipase family protein [Erythrobacter mangrovi]
MTDTSIFKVLSLDGGGAKGFYTLGILTELEAAAGKPLSQLFDLIYGTSTGSIIAALIAEGRSVDQIHELYKAYVTPVMKARLPSGKSAELESLARVVFGNSSFENLQTRLGIVATNWELEKPLIFKSDASLAFGRGATFTPGFGVSIGDAVIASCSAYPFFKRKMLVTKDQKQVEAIDGGFCANNPVIYAIADALYALNVSRANLRVLSLGCGNYPEPKKGLFDLSKMVSKLISVQLLQKTLEANINSMEQLRQLTYSDVATVRIDESYSKPEMATDMFESNLAKLNLIFQRGSESFGSNEKAIAALLGI